MLGQTPGHRNKRNGDKYAFPHPKPSFRIPFPSLTQTPTKEKKERRRRKEKTNKQCRLLPPGRYRFQAAPLWRSKHGGTRGQNGAQAAAQQFDGR
jgi:hypothetical protein